MPPWAYFVFDSSRERLVTRITSPAFAASSAKDRPAMPLPMTRKSHVRAMGSLLRIEEHLLVVRLRARHALFRARPGRRPGRQLGQPRVELHVDTPELRRRACRRRRVLLGPRDLLEPQEA